MSNPWLAALVKKADAGNARAKLALIGIFSEQLAEGRSISPELREYFGHAFRQMGGVSADTALNLGKKEIKDIISFDLDYKIARKVWQLNHRADPLTLEAAFTEVAADAVKPIGEERVRQIYKAKRELVEAEFFDVDGGEERPAHWPPVPEGWKELNSRMEVEMCKVFSKLIAVLKA